MTKEDNIDISKCVNHYFNMRRVFQSGGLRKELTPETCVMMYILFYWRDTSPLKASIMANQIKNIVIEIDSIPF